MYLVDSNVLITAKNRYYGFAICPGFWNWILATHAAGRLFSNKHVYHELRNGDDDLATWTSEELPSSFWIGRNQGTARYLAEIAQWCAGADYTEAARAHFLGDSADYYLVAQAKQHNFGLITHEVPSDSKKRVKIPDAALAIGTKVLNPFDVLASEGAKFG